MRKTLKVLVVDDIKENLKVFKLTLASIEADLETDLAVQCAASGEEAFALLKTEGFDLVISDERLGGMEGTALFKQFRDLSPAHLHIPFIIISSKNSPKDWQEFFKAGVTDFIPKPLAPEKLKFLCRMAALASQIRQELASTREKLTLTETTLNNLREGKSGGA